MANISYHPYGQLQIALDEHSKGDKWVCGNPHCRAVYGVRGEEDTYECGRCGWGPMLYAECAGCGRKVSNANFALVERGEERVWCDDCARGRVLHTAGLCREVCA